MNVCVSVILPLLPYGQDSNSVMQTNSKHRSVLQTRRATVSKSNKWLRLQWPAIIFALKPYFYFVKSEWPEPCPGHRVINYIMVINYICSQVIAQ